MARHPDVYFFRGEVPGDSSRRRNPRIAFVKIHRTLLFCRTAIRRCLSPGRSSPLAVGRTDCHPFRMTAQHIAFITITGRFIDKRPQIRPGHIYLIPFEALIFETLIAHEFGPFPRITKRMVPHLHHPVPGNRFPLVVHGERFEHAEGSGRSRRTSSDPFSGSFLFLPTSPTSQRPTALKFPEL